jgi:hypothetical protein
MIEFNGLNLYLLSLSSLLWGTFGYSIISGKSVPDLLSSKSQSNLRFAACNGITLELAIICTITTIQDSDLFTRFICWPLLTSTINNAAKVFPTLLINALLCSLIAIILKILFQNLFRQNQDKLARNYAISAAKLMALWLLSMAGLFMSWNIQLERNGLANSSWPQALVKTIELTNVPHRVGKDSSHRRVLATYQFESAKKLLSGKNIYLDDCNRPVFDSKSEADLYQKDLLENSSLKVYFNPEKPEENCLKPGADTPMFCLRSALCMIILLLGLFLAHKLIEINTPLYNTMPLENLLYKSEDES